MTEVFQQGELERSQRRAHNPNDVGSNPTPATISREELERTRTAIRAELGGLFTHAERAIVLETDLAKAVDELSHWKLLAASLVTALTALWLSEQLAVAVMSGAVVMIAGLIGLEGRRMRRNRNDGAL